MKYQINWNKRDGKRLFPSTVVSCDGIVVWTTPALCFALGWTVKRLLSYLKGTPRMHSWRITGAEFSTPSRVDEVTS